LEGGLMEPIIPNFCVGSSARCALDDAAEFQLGGDGLVLSIMTSLL